MIAGCGGYVIVVMGWLQNCKVWLLHDCGDVRLDNWDVVVAT
jgi:hypothetical protein